MKHSELVKKSTEMRHSQFLKSHEMRFLDREVEDFIKKINDFFGYNDGEPLDEDGVKFVTDYLKLNMQISLGIEPSIQVKKRVFDQYLDIVFLLDKAQEKKLTLKPKDIRKLIKGDLKIE